MAEKDVKLEIHAFLLKITPCAFLSISFPTGFITFRSTVLPNFFKDIQISDLAGTSFPDLFVYCVSVKAKSRKLFKQSIVPSESNIDSIID